MRRRRGRSLGINVKLRLEINSLSFYEACLDGGVGRRLPVFRKLKSHKRGHFKPLPNGTDIHTSFIHSVWGLL